MPAAFLLVILSRRAFLDIGRQKKSSFPEPGKDAMKNIYLRLAVIGGVVALGATAIGQSMMASREADPEPIEISQIPESRPEEGSVPPAFPPSKVVLAAGETPAPTSAPAQPSSSQFRFNQAAANDPAATAAGESASSAVTSEDGSSPPSRFSRFLSDAAGDAAAATSTTATNAPANEASPAGISRFGNPAASAANPANPAAAPSMGALPPQPQSFAATDAATESQANLAAESTGTAADSAGIDQPPVRFQMSDSPTPATPASAAPGTTLPTPAALAEGAGRVADEAQGIVQDAAQSIRGAAEEAGTRFSSMADSARQSLADEVSRQIAPGASQSASQEMPQSPQPEPMPSGAMERSQADAAFAGNSTNPTNAPHEKPGAAQENFTSSNPTPSVMGSAMPSASAPESNYGGSPRYGATAPQSATTSAGIPATSTGLSQGESMPSGMGGATSGTQGTLVSARPGDERLEGDQTPSIRLEKIAPPEVQVGKVTLFELHVENTSNFKASNVVVRDMIPAGTKLVSTNPPADQGSDGSLVWQLGTLEPKERKNLKLEILPLEEGNIGSVASVSFAAMASAKSVVTRPKLLLEQSGSTKVLAGKQLGITITLSNPGTGAATGIVLEENVPAGFTHPAGRELEFEVGILKPGESRQLELVLNAETAGQTQNLLRARADGNLTAEDALALEVIAPKLQVALSGPSMRYLDRPATYTVAVSNPGTAPAHDIDVVTYLPKGLKFVEANNAGQYDATRHAVFWSLEELPPSQTGTVELVALPIEPGDQRLRVESSADMGLSAQHESTVRVEGLAAIFFEVIDLADPVEVGGETTYEIKVVNQGSKDATNVRVAAQLPQGLQGLVAEGDSPGQINGAEVVFQPIPRIAPKQSVKLSLKVKGIMAGDQRLRVHVTTDGIPDPITKEESTRVYSDK